MSTATDQVVVPSEGEQSAISQGLASPPESNNTIRTDPSSDSELSDVDLSADDAIEPEHWEDDGRVPVFMPTMAQFKDFNLFMDKVNKYGMKSGIVKVIPPPEWKAALPPLDDAIKTIRVKDPIKQDIMGQSGTYRQANILHQRSYNLPQWRQLCDQSEHQPPAKRGERRANIEKAKAATRAKAPSTPGAVGGKRKPGRPSKLKTNATADPENGTPDRLPTPISPKTEGDASSVKQEGDEDDTPIKSKGGRQPKAISVSSRRKNNRRETGVVDEAAFENFKYELEGEDYSAERCEELERHYWRTLTFAPPLYGADMMGSLFDDRTTQWNLGKLPNILDHLGGQIPGVNTAYLYLGMWKATFAWHLEDVDLYSINYLHFGAPKQWYSISQGDARRFEAAMKNIWPADAKACSEFLRHKTFLISPQHLLSNYNIKVNKIVHRPGEFVITFPYGYHSGYNLGYNCAEAVNFGLPSWIEYGKVAKKCDCDQAQDSVWINVRDLERKMNGEETEYETDFDEDEEEEEDDENEPTDLPTPPDSSGDAKVKTKSQRKRKRIKSESDDQQNVKRIRMRIKAPAHEPCVLCPNDIPSEPLLATEDGKQAHRMCAQYIPETIIEETEKKEVVTGIKEISKARFDLKCNYCRSKKGACFQCSKKKCTRAYHATCAAAAGVFVEQGEIPVFGEDGTEYKEWGIEFSCRFHRVKRDKKLDSESLEEDVRIRNGAKSLKVNEVCQMQFYKGDIFAGTIIENREDEETVLVDILPRGDRVEVEYKWILIPDQSFFTLAKPSEKAIPMPKSRIEAASLNTTKRQVDDIPRPEDVFVKGFTWAEFNTASIARNAAQVKLDLSKENQVWYYLGKNSTEARAQFTENLRIQRHNPKGHFLDTIPKAAAPVPRLSYAASYPTPSSKSSSSATKMPASNTSYIGPNAQALQNMVTSKTFTQPASSSATPPPSVTRLEKPYVYKPRKSGDDYHSGLIDAQSYQSQQAFLRQSAASRPAQVPAVGLRFGTDPRFQNNPGSSVAPSAAPSATSTAVAAPKASCTPQTSYAPPPANYAPQVKYAPPRQPYQAAAQRQTQASASPLAPPNTNYRATQSASKGNNPFSSRASAPKVGNVFAKYLYLQIEHNRSPMEYKSPYREGGGFMNGYQGNWTEHLKKTLFAKSGSSTAPSPPSVSSYAGGGVGNKFSYSSPAYSGITSYNSKSTRSPYSSNGSQSHSSAVSSEKPSYASPSISRKQHTPTQQAPPKSFDTNQWERKDHSPLHPAIRKEYSSMFHKHHVPQPRDHQQQTHQQQGEQQNHKSHYSTQYQNPLHRPNGGQGSPGHNGYVSQTSQTTESNQTQKSQQSQPQPAQQATHSSLSQPQLAVNGTSTTPLTQPDPIQQPVNASHQSQPPPPSPQQEAKPLYPHQQYFQKLPDSQVQVQTYAPPPQTHDLPDVPIDSESLIENMLKNLRKVTNSTAK
ncbi:b60b918e-75f3-4fc0-b5f3-c5bdd1d0042e [Sclerotinia trifoliorum]|uniref:[histone H3]-trimethyl-L-lysine(9) demethylase n=1 Tax=Sclerotinia trifoliorum TaxID=28548 RepID=A0A8H2VSP4_9HELO|nr:b60b918e-75f3-4fc0-b5f3-c5bdd1d0042e [Sclerotinia trifoliorum]